MSFPTKSLQISYHRQLARLLGLLQSQLLYYLKRDFSHPIAWVHQFEAIYQKLSYVQSLQFLQINFSKYCSQLATYLQEAPKKKTAKSFKVFKPKPPVASSFQKLLKKPSRPNIRLSVPKPAKTPTVLRSYQNLHTKRSSSRRTRRKSNHSPYRIYQDQALSRISNELIGFLQ